MTLNREWEIIWGALTKSVVCSGRTVIPLLTLTALMPMTRSSIIIYNQLRGDRPSVKTSNTQTFSLQPKSPLPTLIPLKRLNFQCRKYLIFEHCVLFSKYYLRVLEVEKICVCLRRSISDAIKLLAFWCISYFTHNLQIVTAHESLCALCRVTLEKLMLVINALLHDFL